MFNKIYEKIKIFIKENYKFLIFLTILIFVFYYEFPYIIYKSGGTIDLENRVIVETEYEQKGTLSMSYVTAMKGTIPFIALSYVIPDWDLIPLEEITSEEDYDEVIEIGKEYLNEGIDNAIISAFKLLGTGLNIKETYNIIMYISEDAQTDIEVGDRLLKIDDVKINTLDDVKEYINTLSEGDNVLVEVLNNGKTYIRNAKIYKAEDDTLKIGISFKTSYDYTTEIPVTVKMKDNESGSSGSFMMALAIYNALVEEDITKGLNIVGTGSITNEGLVEEIGGVKYKVLAAEKKEADIFLCPEGNYEEAMAIKNKRNLEIEIVKVSTLEEAVNYLKTK